jgi:hypothetical protein
MTDSAALRLLHRGTRMSGLAEVINPATGSTS